MQSWRIFGAFLVLIVGAITSPGQSIFINELHYDDAGTDTLEGVEIAAPAGTNLSCFKILFYNGSTGFPYDSLSLSGIVPNQCNGFGTVWFPFPIGIQNGSPDGLALIFDPTLPGCGLFGPQQVIQFLSYEGVFADSSGRINGMVATTIGVQESSSTVEGNSLQLSGQGVFYNEFSWQSPGPATLGQPNNGQVFNNVACGTPPGPGLQYSLRDFQGGCITPGVPFNLTVCAEDLGGNIDVSYGGGGAIATISIATGPGVLGGVLSQPVVAGCAYFTNLTLSAVGQIHLQVSDLPPGSSLRDTLPTLGVVAACDSCPWMTGAFIDACGPTEGNNEILFFNSGSYHIPTSSNLWNVSYGAGNPPATGYSSSFTQNQDYIDSLNAWAGCNLFVDPVDSGGVPPNSDFIVLRYDPNYSYDFSAWCSQAPVYVFFSDDPDWNTTGNFKNCIDCGSGQSGTFDRFFEIDFSVLMNGAGCDFIYQYNPCSELLCLGSGDGLNFGYGGGSPTLSWNNCIPLAVLPVELTVPLTGIRGNAGVELAWETGSESGEGEFAVYRSADFGQHFSWIGTVAAHGGRGKITDYQYWDADAPSSALFYRLRKTDANGQDFWSNTAIVEAMGQFLPISAYFDAADGQIHWLGLGEGTTVRLFGTDGKEYASGMTAALSSGVYFWQAYKDGKWQTGRVMVAH